MRRFSRVLPLLALAACLAVGPVSAITGGDPDGGGHPFVGWIYGESAGGA